MNIMLKLLQAMDTCVTVTTKLRAMLTKNHCIIGLLEVRMFGDCLKKLGQYISELLLKISIVHFVQVQFFAYALHTHP